jgi:hypothetical protein
MNTIKSLLALLLCFSMNLIKAQHYKQNQDKVKPAYTGKYETNGMVVQVALIKKSLVLIVPGAPLQKLIPAGTDRFRSNSLSDEVFLFTRKNGKIETMVSQRPGQSLELKKISDTPDDFNKADSLLTLKRSTRHFRFFYSKIDSVSINLIASKLENSYNKILADLKVKEIPVVAVRIYPDLKRFHQGINFPNAPDNILATAFGKDDIRMVSPNSADVDSLMLMNGLTHEFTHCIHLNIDYSPNNPRWLWEGLAMFESDWFFDPQEIDFIKNKNFPPLATLGNGMEYMLGYVIIEAIKDIWGFDTVINLVKKRGNVQAVLNLDNKQFEEKIFQHIYKKYILATQN